MEKNINYLFNEVPLYTKESFKIFDRTDENYYNIDESEVKRFLCYIGSYDENLIAYCHKCKKEFPFRKENEISTVSGNTYGKVVFAKEYLNGESFNIDILKGKCIKLVNHKGLWELLEQGKIWYITYEFYCTNDVNHIYKMMITVELKEEYLVVRKVGQNPSMLTIKGFDFDKYKNILEKINAYDDYKKADLSNAEHFHVGAYAYLRRIFEKIVNNFISDAETLEDNHMTTKIEHVKDKFDPRVQRVLNNLYGILSKSIHELDEEDSKEYYEYLKAVIDMQLEYMYAEYEKDKQSKKLEGILSKIASKVNKK